ncbi:MAG: dipeptidase [bacterium]
MWVFDAHCDALTRGDSLFVYSEKRRGGHWDLPRFLEAGGRWQVLSIFTPPSLEGSDAFLFAIRILDRYEQWCERENHIQTVLRKSDLDVPEGTCGILLHLEGANPLKGDPTLLELFFRRGIRSLSFTWNNRNDFADGLGVADRSSGLTHKGKELLYLAESLGVAVDVSHLSEASFWSVLQESRKPVYASHSNVYQIFPHPRNLKEKQLEALAERGGVVCLNFVSEFCGPHGAYSWKEHLKKAIEICGASGVGLGSDFEGCELPVFPDVASFGDVYWMLSCEYEEPLLEGLFYMNLYRFFYQALPE